MNWFRLLKIAVPLPPFEYTPEQIEEGIHTRPSAGLRGVDELMIEEDAAKQHEEHGKLQFEGSGNCGVAFSNNENVVIKYTETSSEYLTAMELMGLQKYEGRVPGFVKVFCAEELKNGVYVIAMEKVETLKGEEKDIVKILYHVEASIYDGRPDHQIIELLKREYNHAYAIDEEEGLLRKIYAKYKKLILDIKEIGGDTSDMHEYNIGKLLNGEYVVLDLGGIF